MLAFATFQLINDLLRSCCNERTRIISAQKDEYLFRQLPLGAYLELRRDVRGRVTRSLIFIALHGKTLYPGNKCTVCSIKSSPPQLPQPLQLLRPIRQFQCFAITLG